MVSIIFTAFYWFLFNGLIYRFENLQFLAYKRWVSLALFNAKCLAGIGLWLVYTFYYTQTEQNDVHKFYNDAVVLHEAALESPGIFFDLMTTNQSNKFEKDEYRYYLDKMKNWNRHFDEAPVNENRLVIRANALLMLVTNKFYVVHILVMCFLAYIGWLLFYNALYRQYPATNWLLALPALFLPSVLCWSSAVLKEPFLVLGMGLLFNGLLVFQFTLKNVLKVVFGIWLIVQIKFYVLMCIAPAAFAFVLYASRSGFRFVAIKYMTIVVLCVTLVTLVSYTTSVNAFQILANKQEHTIKEARYFNAGSVVELNPVSNLHELLVATPLGLRNVLARPYPWESKNLMMLISSAETHVFLFYCIWLAYLSIKYRKVPDNTALLLFAAAMLYFVLIGISTPVLGNLVRYKSVMLPVFIASLILALPKVRLLQRYELLFLQKP